MKKYEFTGETMNYGNATLHRIRRLSDELVGGWIESEANLSHEGDCFVYDDAKVFDNARIYNNAKIYDDSAIFGNAKVYDNAEIADNAEISGYVRVHNNAKIYDDAKIVGKVMICNSAEVYGNTEISKNMRITDNMIINSSFEDLEYHSFTECKHITALKVNGKWLFNIGCQKLITKEEFLNRIHNEDGGLAMNPHREKYIRILNLY